MPFFTPRRTYVTGIYLTLAAVVAVLAVGRIDPPDPLPTITFLALALLAQWNTSKWRSASTISVTSILIAAAIALLGPWGALVVGGLGTLLSPVHWRPIARAFNGGSTGLASVIAACAYGLVGGRILVSQQQSPLWLLVHGLGPLIVAIVVLFVFNVALVAGMIVLTSPANLRRTLTDMIRGSWLRYLGYGLVGFVIAVLWAPVGLGGATVVLMAAPLLLAQWSFREQAAEQSTQQRTVETLVAALEARDPVLEGRGAQIAAIAIAMGESFGLSDEELESLRFAAWLHDVGLASPDQVRPAPHRFVVGAGGIDLAGSDMERLLSHPERGVRMVEGIDFLNRSATAILHHHERWDGRGYPDRLAGAAIPLLARIVAVAATGYAVSVELGGEPAAAVPVLWEHAGSQLDPACVHAFESVVSTLPTVEGRIVVQSGFDHDLPAASDAIAAAQDRAAHRAREGSEPLGR